MDCSDIESFRQKNGYKANLTKYKEALKPKIKNNLLYKSEYFLILHFINKQKKRTANKYIKKAVKHSINYPLYNDYVNAIALLYNKKDEEAYEKLMKLREDCILNTEFVKEIESLVLNIKPVKFDRIEKQWNGIVLYFVNEKDVKDFEDKKKLEERDYQSKVCNFICEFEKSKEEVERVMIAKRKIRKVLVKCDKNKEICSEFISFLSKNFVTNDYLKSYKEDIEKVCRFFDCLVRFYDCDVDFESEIDSFCVPASFSKYEKILNEYKENKKVSYNKAREIMINRIEERLKPKKCTLKVPFLPVYYDIAGNYIKYPIEETKTESVVSGLLKRFSFFGKK